MAAEKSDFSDTQKQELQDSTSCCICTEIYKCPKLLPCGHTFCMDCIQETGLKTSKGPEDEMPCPICRQQFKIPTEGFNALQHNFYVEGLIRVARILDPSVGELKACDSCLEEKQETGNVDKRADMYCCDCKQNLCEECCRHHRKLKLTKNHRLISIDGQQTTDEDPVQSLVPAVCELHKEEDLKIYCCVCKTVVCSICFFVSHEGHKGNHITKAVGNFRKEIEDNVEKVKTLISRTEKRKSELEKVKQDLHKISESLQEDINRRTDIIKRIAEKQANSLLEKLSSIKQSKLKEIQIETDDVDTQLKRLESYNTYCMKLMAKGSACDIGLSVGDLSAGVTELQQGNQSLNERKLKPFTVCLTGIEFNEEDSGNMIGQLQEFQNSTQKTISDDDFGDVNTNQKNEEKKTQILFVRNSDEIHSSYSSVGALEKSTPVIWEASTQYQRVIRIDIDIHRYLMEHPNVLYFSDCSVSQTRVSEQQYDWIFGNSNEKDLQTNEEELKDIIAKLKTRCYSAPNEFDFLIFKDLVQSKNKNENVSLMFIPKERICKIVGPKNAVKTTYEWISNISDDLIKANKQKSGKGHASEVKTCDTRSNAQKLDAQQSGSLGYSAESKVHKTDVGRYPDPKQHVPKAGSGIYISKSSKDKLEFTTRGKLRVSVYQGNMIKQPTEVIVNPANDQLAHGGGLARVILDAGGQVIDDEGRQIIAKQGKLKTSEVVHTSAGKLPHPIRYVIHAVGPTAYEFKDNKAGLVPTLKVTFQNCLEYANKLGVASISLPPISSGIFAVPIPDSIQGAVEAIQDFDRKNPSSALKEVHFISNDAKTTEEMISCFRNVIG